MSKTYAIVGAGLAGCEAAWQLAQARCDVVLYEMKPQRFSPAHQSTNLAELVCSNSFRSAELETGIGLLKLEMAELGSLVMDVAKGVEVPAGKALAVDRELFAREMTRRIEEHPRITLQRREIANLAELDDAEHAAIIIAAGPLASDALSSDLSRIVGQDSLAFYDAIAPIVLTETVDMNVAFWASRYAPENKDYLNCPMNEEEYLTFVRALVAGEKVAPREFEKEMHFEGCLPIEVMAERGEMTLAFGPLKPVGLIDPRTGKQPHAVVQLRAENREKTAMNMVGFQTKLKYGEQKRIFSTIPGLAHAEFLRMGSIHRNTYVLAPEVLTPTLELRTRPGTYLAGQISGVEGYLESAATGLWLGLFLSGQRELPPVETALGALLAHLRTPAKHFQPSNVHFGLMPALNMKAPKKKRKALYAERAREVWKRWIEGE
ncbi:methylenetetrahydrofolate--tRNA-(uracil(54)-C(5))-methyltransferase (FADH(2)-oxidizing) TrmFO [Desulfomicrobium sp. ZS1]|uniref:methylenetetrahydrofolate--tRNA-(uracil(54)- C(5))-methyltransferase (FADH(2)-oxidizing) TrmFO n=1 Tax=Desulfomicrobium sp. ZS1 TaxID=2952228 RepID=UPI0020B3ED19|nr:methylenetetrahydrofolate--tRNA-(uracil(54)-C(5))-methyltransferase (FADH(2)-oxidizing) TrmFO [Desulfomicrobium sp. ZS1]UTF50078.1 methylenetetrahydrofolate--tRNA-(uracil(54)-C(5))-methyltransferase (FADH(2)-oxidizing) TrmFO [Desulfomicrobium sp. ZS1]